MICAVFNLSDTLNFLFIYFIFIFFSYHDHPEEPEAKQVAANNSAGDSKHIHSE